MKAVFRISWLVLLCCTLLGCPPGHFHEYTYTGVPLPNEGLGYTRIPFNEQTDLCVRTGYYNEFILDKENGLIAAIQLNQEFDTTKDAVVTRVTSSVYGELKKIEESPYTARIPDSTNVLMYKVTFPKQIETKVLKRIASDTISIELTTGKTLFFIRNTR